MKNALETKNLTVDYKTPNGDVHALRKVDFALQEGAAVAIVGESGCGKSTLAAAFLKLLPANAAVTGEAFTAGEEVLSKNTAALEKIRGVKAGMIFQEPAASLNPVFTVGQQLEETIAAHRGLKDVAQLKSMSLSLLADVGIDEAERVYNSYPHQLSGGQQQRVMIAIALSCGPSVLIADEPTTALDVTVQAQIVALLKKLEKEKKLATLLVTHDLHLAIEMAPQIAVMYAGEIVEQGQVKDAGSAMHPYTRALFEIIPGIKEGKKEFRVIPGEVPDLREAKNECYFRPRCPRAGEKCGKAHPELEGDNHKVRCFYPYL